MKPYSRNNGIIRVKNRNKYNSVPRKLRRTGFKISTPKYFWDLFSVHSGILLSRYKKSKGLNKSNFIEYAVDKL